MKTALVAIDIQNAFITNETSDISQKIADHIKSNNYDYVLFTQFINKDDSNFEKLLGYKDCKASPEIDLDPSIIEFTRSENIFQKTSYSTFKADGFKKFLDKNNIKKLFICGLDTDSCVLATAYDAFDLGYEIKVLTDLSKSSSGKEFDDAGKKIINLAIQK